MNNSKKTFVNGRSYTVSCLAVAAAIGANVLMFCILAAARVTPTLTYPEEQEPMRIINLDLTLPTDVEPVGMETVMEVIQLGPEQTSNESPQPVAEMISPAFPLLAERISDLSFELPGLSVRTSNISMLSPSRAAPVGGADKVVSAPRVDRIPTKTAGPAPRYPHWARRDRLEATVTLRFIVTAKEPSKMSISTKWRVMRGSETKLSGPSANGILVRQSERVSRLAAGVFRR